MQQAYSFGKSTKVRTVKDWREEYMTIIRKNEDFTQRRIPKIEISFDLNGYVRKLKVDPDFV